MVLAKLKNVVINSHQLESEWLVTYVAMHHVSPTRFTDVFHDEYIVLYMP